MSLQNGFFKTQSSNPVLPPEEWTLVYENTTPGAYSTALGWGKYKIVLSGAGGSGGAASSGKYADQNYANSGEAGKLLTGYINVLYNQTNEVSGIIGSGGQSSQAFGNDTNQGSYSVGAAGTGATNGVRGTGQVRNHQQGYIYTSAGAAGGSGGGSTSASGIGTAAGGKGGNCRARNSYSQDAVGTGGAGGAGSGGGEGAPGGTGIYRHAAQAVSGAGSDGYVRIYKSNLYPEPL